ncbi:dihydroorotate dehydrogenase, putative [Eimeria praecox]|uniref:Dihydroorotate dehydrogenase (quinone), mitochondrial n=1 Tax=Eimeria praecox TaxID=51316 RepID=U6H779_9EIME|nr:dihydroorotate dehydrogenase, putative [Eimeria praecox]
MGAVVPPPSELHKSDAFLSLRQRPEGSSASVQRCIATTSGPSTTASVEELAERPLTGDSSLANRTNPTAVGPPSPRLVEVDMEDMEKQRRKIIKRNNFYGKALLGFLLAGGGLMYVAYAASDVNSGLVRHMDGLLELLYDLLPDNFPDPEMAHRFVMWLASRGYLPYDLERNVVNRRLRRSEAFREVKKRVHSGAVAESTTPHTVVHSGVENEAVCCRDYPELSVKIKGLTFHTPVGLAAGFDKDAEAPLGFCNAGLDVVEPRLKKASEDRWHDRLARHSVIGVNIGKNKNTENAEEDIREGIKRLGRFADYLVINLSSPNTQGLRALQQRDHLRSIIVAAQSELTKLEQEQKIHQAKISEQGDAEQELTKKPQDITHKANDYFPTQTGRRPLLFVKIAPDLTEQEKQDIADVALETGLDGLVVTNTTIQRPESLQSKTSRELGGLSGRPLKAMATQCVSDMYRMTKGQVAIISSGGIETGLDAYERIRAGASAVEVYSSMIYRGPVVARRIKDELLNILNQAGKALFSVVCLLSSWVVPNNLPTSGL